MKNEISAVVIFLSKLLKNNRNLNMEEIETFCDELSRILYDKYVNHWYPETPTKGQAYRCIRVNRYQGVDPDLQKACFNSGLLYEDLGLPKEMTLWVDPCEVCCRDKLDRTLHGAMTVIRVQQPTASPEPRQVMSIAYLPQ